MRVLSVIRIGDLGFCDQCDAGKKASDKWPYGRSREHRRVDAVKDQLFKTFEENLAGRDFVVGDIHGCFRLVEKAMAAVLFDPKKDRLFSVGDLVDRGEKSEDFSKWLSCPWFHAVRGNHEQICIDGQPEMHFINGGAWFLSLTNCEQSKIRDELSSLPLAIEIKTKAGLVGIVHAEVPGDDWNEFIDRLKEPQKYMDHIERFALWGRDIIRGRSKFSGVSGVSKVFVGHTPVKRTVAIENVHYVDTGAVFGRVLTMIDINSGETIEVAA